MFKLNRSSWRTSEVVCGWATVGLFLTSMSFVAAMMFAASGAHAALITSFNNLDFDAGGVTTPGPFKGFDAPDAPEIDGWTNYPAGPLSDAGVEGPGAWWGPYDQNASFMASGNAAYTMSAHTIQASDVYHISFFAQQWNWTGAVGEWTATLFYNNPANVIGSFTQTNLPDSWAAFSDASGIAATPASVGGTLGILMTSSGSRISQIDEISVDLVTVSDNRWNVDADGNWNTASNWFSAVVPAPGVSVTLGDIITDNRTVTLDVSPSVSSLSFQNADGDYFVAPATNQKLTLVGAASVSSIGRHWLQAEVAGTAGLNTAGSGELILDAANTFSGGLNISQGKVSVLNPDAIPSGNAVTTASGSILLLSGGDWFVDNGMVSTGLNGATIGNQISGGGRVDVGGGAEVTLTAANTYSGVTNILEGSTVTLSGSGTLGASDGTAATRTTIQDESQLVLSGVAVGQEYIVLDENNDGEPAKIVSTGTSSIAGNIHAGTGDVGGHYEINTDSGTLTLSGVLSAFDGAAPNDRIYVFSGAGNTNVTGKITDSAIDANGNDTGTSAGDNVHVVKRGAGKLTIGTASAIGSDYWSASTTIEQGTLEVISDGANQGALSSSSIDVRAGATFDIDHFGSYVLRENQVVGGAGTIVAQNLAVYDDNVLNPGDSVGTLTINGNVSLNLGGASGAFNYELGDATTIGGTENDLIQINGSLTNPGISAMSLNVRPVEGILATGTYRLINHSGSAVDFSGVTPRVVDGSGNPLDTRQTLAVSGATAGQVNLTVSGSAANLTWAGTTNGTWDVTNPAGGSTAGTANWSGGSTKFAQLDRVTFGNAGSNKNITVAETVAPGTMTVTGASANYTFSGSNISTTSVTVSSGATASFANTVGGNVIVQNTGTLAGSGTFQDNVSAQAGSKIRVGGAGLSTAPDTRTTAATGGVWNGVVEGTNNSHVIASDQGKSLATSGGTAWRGAERDITGTGAAVTVGEVQTYFWQVQATYTQDPSGWDYDFMMGLSPSVENINEHDAWSDFAVMPYVNNEATTPFINANAPGTFWAPMTPDTWTNVWVVVNNDATAPTYDLYYSTGTDAAVLVASGANWRGADNTDGMPISAGMNLNAIGFMAAGNAGNELLIDNIYYASGTQTATNPVVSPAGWALLDNFDSYTSPSILVGATMNFQGDLSLQAGSTISLDIAATGINDKIVVTGDLGVADGVTLEVLLDNSVLASSLVAGDSWDLFDFGTISGILDPNDFVLPAGLNSGLEWDTSTLLTTGVLSVISSALPGDFDGDGDVDGRDFLVWQRNPGIGDLADWQANYGAPLLAASTANAGSVPEPAAALLLAIGVCGLACHRQSRR